MAKGAVADARTQAKKLAFLTAFAELGTITHAARAAGIERRSHYDWLESDPAYPSAFAEAQHQANDALVREARRRAVEGVDKPVYQGKELVGLIREYSDTLLIFLLKGALPDVYRDRVEMRIDIHREAEAVAAQFGLDADAVLAEAEAILAAHR